MTRDDQAVKDARWLWQNIDLHGNAMLVLARWEHPDWSWKQIGQDVGLTRVQARNRFMNLVRKHGVRTACANGTAP